MTLTTSSKVQKNVETSQVKTRNSRSIRTAFEKETKVRSVITVPEVEEDHHDFLTIGLNVHEQELMAEEIKKENEIKISESSKITNPFFVPLKGSNALAIPKKDFYTIYSYCYSLLLRSNVTTDVTMISQIYNREMTVADLRNILKNFTLVKTDIKILHNNNFKRVTNLISRAVLDTLFNVDEKLYNFQDVEFIVPLFNLSESDARNYLSLYAVSQNIDSLSSIMSTVNLFNADYTVPIDQSVERLLQNLDPHSFWTLSKNCKFPLFEIFNDRSFAYNGIRLDHIKAETLQGAKSINHLIKEIEANDNSKRKRRIHEPTANSYGLPGTDGAELDSNDTKSNEVTSDRYAKSEFQNLYKVLRNQKDRTFYVNTPNLNVTKGDIADIFDRITNERFRFELFNTLLISKDYCHLVYNNQRVLERNADLFKKYRAFYSYAFFYAHATMYLEESVLLIKSTKFHRHVFDLETAHFLPTFPFNKKNLYRNPYLTLLLPNDVIDPDTNLVGLHTPFDHEKYLGLTTTDEALKRFNIFCTGDPNKNLFDIEGIDKTTLSVSGSIMPACLQKLSPLFEKCTSEDTPYVKRWQTFFKHYYGESDIDLMCRCETVTQLILYGTKFINHICKTLEINRDEIDIKPCKKSAIVITKHFFNECIDDVNDALGTNYTTQQLIEMFDQLNMNVHTEEFDQLLQDYFYTDYCAQKSKRNTGWRKSKKETGLEFDKGLEKAFTDFTPFNDFTVKAVCYDISEVTVTRKDSEIYFFINDFRDDEDKVPPEENFIVFKYSESLKFKIGSQKMTRDVEMFMIRDYDPFSTVAKFHLPCVRAYYQNGKFYMLPSFITAMHTGINIDYKYFAGSRDPANICQKYLSRGYGIILNASEKKGIITYSKAVDEYNGMYKADNCTDIFGPKEITHNFFCPGVFKLGMDREVYFDHHTRYARNDDDIIDIYRTESGYDPRDADCVINVLNLNPVLTTGNISPYKSWVADAFYDYMKDKTPQQSKLVTAQPNAETVETVETVKTVETFDNVDNKQNEEVIEPTNLVQVIKVTETPEQAQDSQIELLQ